jgi:SpoVK/Ycf46/Vps4 family AAA+-type ATPase
MLAAQAGRGPGAEDKSTANVNSIVWKTLPIIPQKRMPIKELLERFYTRSLTSAALLARAVDQLGGSLVDPLSILSLVRVRGEGASIIDSARKEVNEAQAEESGKKVEAITEKLRKDLNRARRNLTTSKTSHAPEQSVERLLDNVRKAADKGWHNAVKSWVYAQHLGSSALGRVLTTRHRQGAASESPVSVKWTDIMTAWQAEQDEDATMKRHIKRHLPRRPASATPVEDPPGQPLRSGTVTDTVVERIKKAKDLSTHERRLLSCIVDTSKLSATTFEDVHLPYKTIDAIRTLISLPLLFPEAFQGGVLKDHSTTGALLFGPPGTGKTLLARAVASESGARMLAVQVSALHCFLLLADFVSRVM